MISSQKNFITLALLLLPGTLHPMELVKGNAAKTAACLLGAGVTLWTVDKGVDSGMGKNICNRLGVSTKDAKNLLGISSSFWWLGQGIQLTAGTSEFAQGCKQLACITPIAASVAKATSTKTFQDIAQSTPLIGKHVTCSNSDCKGVCTSCQLTKGTILIGAYAGIRAALPSLCAFVPHLKK